MRKEKWPVLGAITVLFIGLTVLVGWAFGVLILKNVFSGAITMKSNTAFCFVLLAVSILSNAVRSRIPWISRVCLLLVALIAVATLYEYLMSVDFGLDQFLVRDPDGQTGRFPPGRLAPITAVCFVCLCFSIELHSKSKPTLRVIGQMLAAWVAFVSFQSLVSFCIGLNSLFGSAFYTRMAFHTSIAFIFSSFSILSLKPQDGLLAIIAGPEKLAKMNRWILFSIFLIPPLVYVLSSYGLERGYFDHDFSTLIQVVGGSGLMCVIFVVSALALHRSERLKIETEGQLRESEERFRLLCDSMTQLAWIATAEGEIHWYNKRWYEYTGTDFHQVKGEGWSVVHHPDHVESVVAFTRDAWKKSDPWELTFPLKSASGDWRWFLTRAVPVKDDSGKVVKWLGTNTDVNEQTLANAQLRIAKEQAEQASKMKSAFLANMSHEMRTPLGLILGFAELNGVEETKEKVEEYRRLIAKSGSRLRKLINDVIEISKSDGGELKLQLSRVRPQVMIEETLEELAPQSSLERQRIRLKVQTETPHFIVTDADRIKQILFNLVENALKFSSESTIAIEVSYDASDRLIVTVEDGGPGIELADQERIFESFVQADVTMTRKHGGAGLGLTLSKRLAGALGGELRLIRSRPGEGSKFEVTILNQISKVLAQGGGPLQSAVDQSSTSSRLDGISILVVDDVRENRILLQRQLQKRGAHVETAENGSDAVRIVSLNTYNCILMDIQMPVMDGYEATELIRKGGFVGPIFAVTAHTLDDVVERCQSAGCTAHIAKPVDFNTLTRKIRAELAFNKVTAGLS